MKSGSVAPETWGSMLVTRAARGLNPWFLSVAANGLIGLVGVFTSSITARGLGPAGRGVLAESMLWAGVVLIMGAVVNTPSVTYFAAKAESERAMAEVLGSGLVLAAVLSIVLVPCAWLANFVFLGSQSAAYRPGLVYALIIPTMLLSAAVTSTFLATKNVGTYWGLRIVNSLVYASGLVGLALVHSLTVERCVTLALIASTAQALGALLTYAKKRSFRCGWDASSTRAMAIYGAKTNAVGLPFHLNVRLDQILMSLLLPPQILGYYVVAVSWSLVLSYIGRGVSIMMLAESTMVDKTSSEQVDSLLVSVRIVFTLLLTSGGLAMLLTPFGVIVLFGQAYSAAIWPAMILCVAAVALNMNLVMHEVLRGLGRPGIGIVAELTALGMTGTLLVALLPRMGAVGAAMTSLIAYCGSFVILITQVSRSTNAPMRRCIAATPAEVAGVIHRAYRANWASR